MSGRPWYHDGLRFQCTECGACCTGAPGHVWVNRAEINALAAALGVEQEEFERAYVRQVGTRKSLVEWSNGDCVLLDGQTRRCKLHNVRPRQCRTWPFWASNLSTPKTWQQIGVTCPGTNQGRLVPLQEILVCLKAVRV